MSSKDLSFKLGITKDNLTSHSGLVLFGEYVNRLGLLDYSDRLFGKPGSNKGYSSSSYLLPLLLKFHGGGVHLDDIRQIKEDDALLDLLKVKKVPTSAALGEWLRRHGRGEGQTCIKKLNHKILSNALSMAAETEYTLDIDATEIIAKKRDALYTYKKNKGYMPIIGNLAENGMIVHSEFRSGNISPSTRNYEFMKHCIRLMPKGKKITSFRADSASYQNKIINYCEQNDISFAIGGDLDSSTKKSIATIREDAWAEFGDGEIAETIHRTNGTEFFRLIVKRKLMVDDMLGKAYFYYPMVSNRKDETAAETRRWYNQRGETSENRIKEFKIGYNLEKLPCGQHNANALYFYIGHMAYNLGIMFRDNILPAEFKNSQIATIRWRFYQLAAKVVRTARAIYFKVQPQYFELFQNIRLKFKDVIPI